MIRDEMLTIDELAQFLKLKAQTIYKWAQSGKIPGAKFGKEWRFRRSLIERWIDHHIAETAESHGGFDFPLQSDWGRHATEAEPRTGATPDRRRPASREDPAGSPSPTPTVHPVSSSGDLLPSEVGSSPLADGSSPSAYGVPRGAMSRESAAEALVSSVDEESPHLTSLGGTSSGGTSSRDRPIEGESSSPSSESVPPSDALAPGEPIASEGGPSRN